MLLHVDIASWPSMPGSAQGAGVVVKVSAAVHVQYCCSLHGNMHRSYRSCTRDRQVPVLPCSTQMRQRQLHQRPMQLHAAVLNWAVTRTGAGAAQHRLRHTCPAGRRPGRPQKLSPRHGRPCTPRGLRRATTCSASTITGCCRRFGLPFAVCSLCLHASGCTHHRHVLPGHARPHNT